MCAKDGRLTNLASLFIPKIDKKTDFRVEYSDIIKKGKKELMKRLKMNILNLVKHIHA
jgi:hypothetical protein